MTEVEAEILSRQMEALAEKNKTDMLLANIAMCLHRIAAAQEDLVALAKMDLEAAINEEVESRASQKANEIVQDSTKRSFIGKR